MKFKLKKLIGTDWWWSTISAFPVEMALCVAIFVLGVFLYEDILVWHSKNIMLGPLCLAFTFILNCRFKERPLRLIYYLSWIVFPLLWVCVAVTESWVYSIYYVVAIIDALLAIVVCRWMKSNKLFVSETFKYLRCCFSAIFFAVVIHLLLILVYVSVVYIFNIFDGIEKEFYIYSSLSIYGVLMPLMFFMFYRQYFEDKFITDRSFEVLINYVFTPALMIYAVILYIYFIQIIFTWSLPKGKIAYMVFIFTMIAMAVRACRTLIIRRKFGWFFNFFSLISLPALVMFWLGVLYRVNQYGLTEDRVYLIACGIIMTICMAMFLSRRSGRYLYLCVLIAVVLGSVSFFPPVSAENLAIYSQKARFEQSVRKLQLINDEGVITTEALPESDSVYKEDFHKAYNSLEYLISNGVSMSYAGIESSDDLLNIVPSGIRDYVRDYDTESGDYSSYLSLWDEDGFTFSTDGFSYLHQCPYRKVEDALYSYCYCSSGDTLFIYEGQKIIWDIPYNRYFSDKLISNGYTDGRFPTKSEIENMKQDLMYYRTDSMAVIFSHVNLVFTNENVKVSDLSVDCLLSR